MSTIAKSSKNSSTAQVEEAVAFIRQSAAKQLENTQAIMDGAVLAAEQVQDKRLEVLERGPEVSGFDIFISFAITFVLESPLAGKLLRGIATNLLAPRIRAHMVAKRKALQLLDKKPRDADLLDWIHQTESRLKQTQRLSGEIKSLINVERTLHNTGADEEGPYPYLVAFGKAAREAAGKMQAPALEPSDTPGVTILDLAQSHVSRERLCLQIEQSMFELWLRTGLMSPNEVYTTMKWGPVKVDGQQFEVAQIKDHWKRYFELLIWGLLLYERPFTGAHVTTPQQSFALKGYVQPSLIDYWLKRFIDPATNQPFSKTPAVRAPGVRPVERAVGKLGEHLWKVTKEAVNKDVRLPTAGKLVPRQALLKE